MPIDRIKLDAEPTRAERIRQSNIDAIDDRIERRARVDQSTKSRGIYIILALLGGLIGLHSHYSGRYAMGFAQLFGLVAGVVGSLIYGAPESAGCVAVAFVLVSLAQAIFVRRDGLGRPFAL